MSRHFQDVDDLATIRPTFPPKKKLSQNNHAAQRLQQREENQRQKRLREARHRDIDADLPLYLKRPHLTREDEE